MGLLGPFYPLVGPQRIELFRFIDSFYRQLAEQEFVESLLLSTARLLTPSFFAVIVKES
jgi:hypothetical protein